MYSCHAITLQSTYIKSNTTVMRQNLTRYKLFYINANKKANICKKYESAMQKNLKGAVKQKSSSIRNLQNWTKPF